jgi:sec-independent protein translocase protein TatA
VYPLAVFGLGPGEIILLLVVILIVFGAGRLPQIGTSLGKGLKNFKKGLKGEDEDKDEGKPKP